MNTKQKIHSILTSVFSTRHLDVNDESALHHGHAESQRQGGGHFKISIVSNSFIGKTPLMRHRMIYDALERELKGEIHALGIKAFTTEEWKQNRGN